jgi:phosphatidylethanolamine-binding protein (PEBP) family uncharacterized protein
MLPVAVCSLIGSTATQLRSRTNLRRLIAVASPTGGIYNIACEAAGLPADASAAGSAFGNRCLATSPTYDGPCPPPNFPPNVHHYVFTVYALASELDLPLSANFPANAGGLLRALLQGAMRGDVWASASITGFYSTTPTK